MKTSVRLLFLMLVMLVGTSQLFAQARKGQIEVFGGLALPLSPEEFKDYFKMGFSLHGQYVMFPSSQIGISFGAAYERFTFDGDAFLQDLEEATGLDLTGFEVDGNASIIEFGVGIRPYLTKPEASTQFYLFGMGTYNLLKSEATVSFQGESEKVSGDENKPGVALGVGLEFPAGEKINILTQALFRFVFTEGDATNFVGITAGVAF